PLRLRIEISKITGFIMSSSTCESLSNFSHMATIGQVDFSCSCTTQIIWCMIPQNRQFGTWGRFVHRLKVAMISPYGPGWIGGISGFTMSLSDGLRRLGIDCQLLVNRGGVAGRTITLRGPKPLFVIRSAIWLGRHRPHVLHAHAHWHTLLPALLYKAFHRGVKVV